MKSKTMFTGFQKVANGTIQAIMSDHVVSGNTNALALLNKGDERFSVGSLQYHWPKVTIDALRDEVEDIFGNKLDEDTLEAIEALNEGEKFLLDEPFVGPNIQGQFFRIRIQETTIPTPWQAANFERAVKQITIDGSRMSNMNSKFNLAEYDGEQGIFLTKDGEPIFQNKVVAVVSEGVEPRHNKFTDTQLVPQSEYTGAIEDYTLASPSKAEKEVEV